MRKMGRVERDEGNSSQTLALASPQPLSIAEI
jgi:hypothetical protein